MAAGRRQYLTVGVIGLAAGTLAFALALGPGPIGNLLHQAELTTYDWRMRPRRPRADDIVLICIDEQSLQELGVWPWPRGYHAQVLSRLAEAGAKIIAVDIVFSGVTSDEAGEELAEQQDIAYEPALGREDEELERALKEAGNVVLAARIAQESVVGEEAEATYETTDFPHWRFEEAARSLGMANLPKDIDNVVRRTWLSMEHQEELYPTLGVQVAAESLGIPAAELHKRISRTVNLRALDPGKDSLLIDFRGPEQKAFSRVS